MANYAYTFVSGDTVTPTKLNNARTISNIVNADVSATAAIAGTKIAPNFGSQNVFTTGAIAVGTTSPSFELEIRGRIAAIRPADESFVYVGSGTGSGEYGFVRWSPNTSILSFGTDSTNSVALVTNNQARLHIGSDGAIGIGTVTPGYLLDVRGGSLGVFNAATEAFIRLGQGTGAAQYGFLRWSPITTIFSVGTDANAPLALVTNNADRLRITAAGNVGIGTSSPTVKLDVAGDINTSEAYGVDGVQVVANRRTGWTAATGTATRTSFATSTVTTEQLAERVKALIDDLANHGLIGS